MCRRVDCPTCQKPGWVGCGAHVEQVLADVPKADRCHCSGAGHSTARRTHTPEGGRPSWRDRLRGR